MNPEIIPLDLICENEVHLWKINPKARLNTDLLKEFKRIISAEELKKIERYRQDSAKHAALITRAFLRIVLSKYECISPEDWRFSYSDLGKPEVINSKIGLRFNLSHNKDIIICAVCVVNDIGCDIESLTRKMSITAISKRFFCPEEADLISMLREDLQRKAFFELWTLKEAFVKATGKGISQGLDTFKFLFNVDQNTAYREDISLFLNQDNKPTTDWFNALIYPDNTHVIAVSVKTRKMIKVILKGEI